MSGQHTPGRLVVRGSDDEFVIGNDLPPGKGRYAVAVIRNEHDARRLAACWNACELCPTEAIENLAAAGGVVEAANGAVKVITRLAAARTELAAARALLRDAYVIGDLDIGSQSAKELGKSIRSYLDACDTLGEGAS